MNNKNFDYGEIKKDYKESILILKNRRSISITGAKKIINLNDEEFDVETNNGLMHVSGKHLEMKDFNTEQGNMQINGIIDSIEYYDENPETEKKQSFFKKVFK